MNNKCSQETIDSYEYKYSSERIRHKNLYRDKYDNELKTCYSENEVGFNTGEAVMWLKERFPEGVVET